jgi:predicted dehydrogenase
VGVEMIAVGVVGAGWAAREFHLPGYTANTAVDVVAIADVDRDRRTALARQFAVPATYGSAEQMFDRETIDAVSICTPPNTHEELFLEAIERGCHVYCEKPLTTSAESAERMYDAARAAGVVTQMGYKLRFYSNYRKVLSLVQRDLLGEVLRVSAVFQSSTPTGWYSDPSVSGGGVMRDLLPHVLDFYLEVFDVPPDVERCLTEDRCSDGVEDFAEIGLSFEDTRLDLTLGWSNTDGLTHQTLVGEQGWVVFDRKNLEGRIGDSTVRFRYGEPPVVDLEIEQLFLASDEETDNSRRRVDDFIDGIRNGTGKTRAPVRRGRDVTRIVSDLYCLSDR